MEAERRLFYVAITRASQQLFVAHPNDPDFTEFSENVSSENWISPLSPVSSFLWEMELALARHAGSAVETAGPFQSAAVTRPGVANAYFQRFPFASSW